ncbi:ComEC/Rec2 family competence protein [Nautilia lithotrophica]
MNYLDFRYDKFKEVDVKVVNQYKKEGKRGEYFVLKLKNRDLTFYTTSKEDLKNLLNENLKLTIITSNVTFKDYLFTFYAPGFNIKLLPVAAVDEFIEKQHSDIRMTNIYKALFFGESIDYKTRQELSTLGISHLIALSGLHLGFISLFLYLVFTPVYKVFQKRFPYRNRFVDLAVLIFVIEFVYLYITGFPPSLIRAYVLEIVVFLYAYNLQNPFSLKVLGVVFLFSLLIFGQKVFSIGYFLSITGVFYIYLFFRYYRPTFLNSLLLSFYMFCVMFIISHSFFGNFNPYQFLSPFVNLLFTAFYPLVILLHLFGIGGMFDGIVLKYLQLGESFESVKFPLWFGMMFLGLSVFAFFSKRVFFGINLLSLVVIFYVTGVYIV